MAPAAVLGSRRVYFLAGRFFPHILVAGKTEVSFFRQQELGHFRFMRTVAFGAITGDNRLVFTLAGFQRCCQIPMTGKAQFFLFIAEHSRNVAPVGIMTGKAHSTLEGFVVSATGFQFHEIVMAFCAESRSLGLQQFFLIAAVGVMASITGAAGHRFMCPGFEEARLGIGVAGVANLVHSVFQNIFKIRAMNVMAGRAH